MAMLKKKKNAHNFSINLIIFRCAMQEPTINYLLEEFGHKKQSSDWHNHILNELMNKAHLNKSICIKNDNPKSVYGRMQTKCSDVQKTACVFWILVEKSN